VADLLDRKPEKHSKQEALLDLLSEFDSTCTTPKNQNKEET